ncbi:MAG: ABC transporter permease [Candidatus Geothermarchaeales archaeon]
MGLFRTLVKRGVAIFGVVLLMLLFLTLVAGASGVEERVLTATLDYERALYRGSLRNQVGAGQIREEDVSGLVDEFYQAGVTRFRLDRPWWERLLPMAVRIATFDLGATSSFGRTPIYQDIAEALPNTLLLLTASVVISAPIGILIGASLARRVRARSHSAPVLGSSIAFAVPGWWLGTALTAALVLAWFGAGQLFVSRGGFRPQVGSIDPLFDLLYYWVLPIVSLAVPALGFWIYQSRAIFYNISQEDFVTMAEAKGLPPRQVARKHILRVGLPPVLTQAGLVLHSTMMNSVPVEAIFGWHGLGFLIWRIVWTGGLEEWGNAGLLLGVTFAYGLIYAVLRFGMEILYVVLDPGVRY